VFQFPGCYFNCRLANFQKSFISTICKNQLIDFQAFTHLKLRVLLRSEREHGRFFVSLCPSSDAISGAWPPPQSLLAPQYARDCYSKNSTLLSLRNSFILSTCTDNPTCKKAESETLSFFPLFTISKSFKSKPRCR
jgi:hypothetical protein